MSGRVWRKLTACVFQPGSPGLILPSPVGERSGKRGIAESSYLKPSPRLSQGERENLANPTNRFDRTDGHCLLTSRPLGVIFRLLADIGIRVLERTREVFGGSVATNVAIYAGRVDKEGAVNVLFYDVVSVGHESADYADFSDLTNSAKAWRRNGRLRQGQSLLS